MALESALIAELRLSAAQASPAAAKTLLDGLVTGTDDDPDNWTDMATGLIINQIAAASSFDLSEETEEMASGNDKNCQQGHAMEWELRDANPYLLLDDFMVGGGLLAAQVVWTSGKTTTYNGLRFQGAPILSPVPNVTELWGHPTQAVATDPPNTGWVDLGDVLIDQGAEFNFQTFEDGAGRDVYASMIIQHILGVDFTTWGTNESAGQVLEPGALSAFAIKLSDNSYVRYNNMYAETRRLNAVGRGSVRTTQIRINNGAAQLSSVLTLPGQGELTGTAGSKTYAGATAPSMADCIFGYRLAMSVTGNDETDFMVEGTV